MRRGLHLRLADAAAGKRPGRIDAGVAEPGPLRRRVRLGAQPDVERAGLGVERLHGGAGVDLGLLFLCDGGHGFPPVKFARVCASLPRSSGIFQRRADSFARTGRGMMNDITKAQGRPDDHQHPVESILRIRRRVDRLN